MQFPKVSGRNLDREHLTFPEDFTGQYNIVLIAFQQWQQTTVNTWLPFVRDQIAVHDGLTYYEFPVIQSMNMLSRWFINEGMRAGIPDPVARQKTITLYLNKRAFRNALDITTEQEITILLVDHDGQVLARSQGQFTPEKGTALLQAVQEPALALH
jgi:hypothetical protein